MDVKFVSLADNVFERIETDILEGNYKKGELLTETALSKRFAISRTPIREAIRRLEQDNLVKETSKGHIVLGISVEDIMDIYDIRLKIEGTATARSALRITDEELSRLSEILDLQKFYAEKGIAEKVKAEDSSFHELIYSCCGSEVYASILLTLHKKVQLYRKRSMQIGERAMHAIEEHREILNALKAHDAPLADALAVKHVNNAKINIMGVK